MTEKQILLVKHSWSYVAGRVDEITPLFSKTLISLNPSLKPLVLELQTENKLKDVLMTINDFVASLPDLKKSEKKILNLITLFSNYDLTYKHYNIALKSFLVSLQKKLGEIWNLEIYDAWIIALSTLYAYLIDQHQISSTPSKNI